MTLSAPRKFYLAAMDSGAPLRGLTARRAAGWRRIRKAAELASAVVIVALFARAVLMILTPLPTPPVVDAAVAGPGAASAFEDAGGNPFRIADNSGPASSAPLTESALNIVLHGTWRDAANATAVISADGAPQRKVAVGEEIIAGVTLEEVQDEFVVISNNGVREAVAIVNRKVDMTAPARADEAAGEVAPPPAALRGAEAAPPLTVSASALALRDDRAANTIAAAAPHEPE
ncbi:MAG TPA: hypothetical protein DDZ68_03100 [Parvularcula sp.]|nr:hypothetical protein [Parvularcula sp.]